MSTGDLTSGGTPLRHQRKLRNYLLDAGLQVRYTVFVVAVAAFLTAVLGWMIYQATRDISKAVAMTSGVMDPLFTAELEDKFRANDRVVLFGIIGFGVLLVLSIFASG